MGVAPPQAHSMQMVGPWGRYLPQWLRVPGNGSGPAICQHILGPRTLPTMSVLNSKYGIQGGSVYHTHTSMQVLTHTETHTRMHARTHAHTHTEDLTHQAPLDIHVSSHTVYQTHTCMQAPIPTLCIPAKTHTIKGQ